MPSAELGDVTIEHGDYRIAARHRATSPWQKVVVHINYDQSIAGNEPDFLSPSLQV